MIDDDVRRELYMLLQGKSWAVGEFSLSTNSTVTSTVVTRTGVSSNSAIMTQALTASAANADIVRVVPVKDSFTVVHTGSTAVRTYRYSYLTGKA